MNQHHAAQESRGSVPTLFSIAWDDDTSDGTRRVTTTHRVLSRSWLFSVTKWLQRTLTNNLLQLFNIDEHRSVPTVQASSCRQLRMGRVRSKSRQPRPERFLLLRHFRNEQHRRGANWDCLSNSPVDPLIGLTGRTFHRSAAVAMARRCTATQEACVVTPVFGKPDERQRPQHCREADKRTAVDADANGKAHGNTLRDRVTRSRAVFR